MTTHLGEGGTSLCMSHHNKDGLIYSFVLIIHQLSAARVKFDGHPLPRKLNKMSARSKHFASCFQPIVNLIIL